MLKAAAALAIALATPGCAPVLIGAIMWDHIEARKDRKEFVESFNRQNLEREKAGLPKLDWCQELRQAKPSWANDDPRCKGA